MAKQFEYNGRLVRSDDTVPLGHQMFWWRDSSQERLLCSGVIGVPVKGIKYNMMTLNPADYELLYRSYLNARETSGGASRH